MRKWATICVALGLLLCCAQPFEDWGEPWLQQEIASLDPELVKAAVLLNVESNQTENLSPDILRELLNRVGSLVPAEEAGDRDEGITKELIFRIETEGARYSIKLYHRPSFSSEGKVSLEKLEDHIVGLGVYEAGDFGQWARSVEGRGQVN